MICAYADVMHHGSADLKSAAQSILMECRQIFAARQLLELDQSDVVVRNALLESVLVHARSIGDFLDGMSKTSGGVSAFHYVSASDWPKALTKSGRDDINKRLMHATTTRTARAGAAFELDDILTTVGAAWRGFVTALSREHPDRASWFRHDPTDRTPESFVPGSGSIITSNSTSPVTLEWFSTQGVEPPC